MKRTLLILAMALTAPMAHAQQSPLAVQHGPDLQFACDSPTGQVRSCHPVHPRYKRYMHLANWRYVGSASPAGTCVLGHTYGYGRDATWVSGSCVAVFQAPDLRYGDAYNGQRLAEATRDTIVIIAPIP